MNQTQQQTPADWLYQNGPNVIQFVAHSWATSLEVFLRRNFGVHYLNTQAALVLLLVPGYCLAWDGQDVRPMFYFLGAYLLMCLVARLGMIRRQARGEYCHSRYNGWPRLMRLLPTWSETTVKTYVEPVAVLGAAYLIESHSVVLTGYLVIGAFCLIVTGSNIENRERRRAVTLQDAMIEQELTAERVRGQRGTPW